MVLDNFQVLWDMWVIVGPNKEVRKSLLKDMEAPFQQAGQQVIFDKEIHFMHLNGTEYGL